MNNWKRPNHALKLTDVILNSAVTPIDWPSMQIETLQYVFLQYDNFNIPFRRSIY